MNKSNIKTNSKTNSNSKYETVKRIRKEFLHPINLIILFANVSAFIIMQVLFFWFIASKAVERVVENKVDLIVNTSNNIPEIKEKVMIYLNDKTLEEQLKEDSIDESYKREKYNSSRLMDYLYKPLSLIITLLYLSFVYSVYIGYKWSKVDFILLGTVFLAFTTEIIFYVLVIQESQVLGDTELISALMSMINVKST